MRTAALLALLLASAAPAFAGAPVVAEVKPTLETTPPLPDNDYESDADDPAVWVAPNARYASFVATAVKKGGIRVYDLSGKRIQVIDPQKTDEGKGRINNVDVAYGVKLKNGRTVDVVVASDRALDRIRVYQVAPGKAEPLVDVTPADPARAFPKRPLADGTGLEDNPLDDQHTAYGLTTWSNRTTGKPLVIVTQRGEPRLGVFRLEPQKGGKIVAKFLFDYRVPVVHDGQSLREESDDPKKDWSPQFEGLVVDQRNGILYAGQEDVGIWRIDLKKGAKAVPTLVYETRGSTESSFHEPTSVIARDVEGLCIYYGRNGTGYLLASSQGGAHGDNPSADAPYDDSFAVFGLKGTATPKLLGSYRVAAKGGIDAVQESDGAEVISNALPGFPRGLFVTQDGYDDDLDGLSGETPQQNFKFVSWPAIAARFSPPLAVTPGAFDPRKP
ncbi:phytase [Oharaeibacter diazotrophicus]|uniref:3-phytase n=1 Tax=Oharaeibacter diazotrophicus TaxID=1920512 RepID=A0A4V3CVJ3_9HYPH|nr:phytase [Oharaeibacter diazotrophicus]TDP82728.1 3-phytase [Oharaeibacter diazotrophicus]BBE72510.1 3-phytase precursor [Pleomorphomonas sp. SM30]GLS76541.1 hydrolase [Oharaeibacter diazotrophicus]